MLFLSNHKLFVNILKTVDSQLQTSLKVLVMTGLHSKLSTADMKTFILNKGHSVGECDADGITVHTKERYHLSVNSIFFLYIVFNRSKRGET